MNAALAASKARMTKNTGPKRNTITIMDITTTRDALMIMVILMATATISTRLKPALITITVDAAMTTAVTPVTTNTTIITMMVV